MKISEIYSNDLYNYNSSRDLLKEGQTIELSSRIDGSMPERYTIRSYIGEGGSAVCYEAIRERDGHVGRLKEFYPASKATKGINLDFTMERRADGQLVPQDKDIYSFDEKCKDYIGSYSLLNEILSQEGNEQVLKNYIQIGEVLYGINKDITYIPPGVAHTASVYVWSSGIAGQKFSDYLKEVRHRPYNEPDKRLADIIDVVKSLTDCVKALHTEGLIHLDIKPSNFLVPFDSELNINTSSVSMFDINTLQSVDSRLPIIAGTQGYMAPEIKRGRADNRSDIYSIGAMLFNAIIINDDIKDGLYRDELYSNIESLVRDSKIIAGSDSVSNHDTVTILSNILKKCLAYVPDKRYDCCADLMEDLKKASDCIEPFAQGKRTTGFVSDKPDIIMHKLLYDKPLYEALRPGQKTINILIIGFGIYAEKFTDTCMNVAKVHNYRLSVVIASENPISDKADYQHHRPDLERCFIDDENGDDTVSAIRFLPYSKDGNEQRFVNGNTDEIKAVNTAILNDILLKTDKYCTTVDYVFVSAGVDSVNKNISDLLSEQLDDFCTICYISEDTFKKPAKSSPYAVTVKEQITPESIDSQAEQTAYGNQKKWSGVQDTDIGELLEGFRHCKSDYSSSLSFALSIKYKLYSIGIILDSELKSYNPCDGYIHVKNMAEAAYYFSELLCGSTTVSGIFANSEYFDAAIQRLADKLLYGHAGDSKESELRLVSRAKEGDGSAWNELAVRRELGADRKALTGGTIYDEYLNGVTNGSDAALYNLGDIYEKCSHDVTLLDHYGIRITGNELKNTTAGEYLFGRAKECYEKAAEHDYAPAIYALGRMEEEDHNFDKALDHYRKAAEMSYPPAQNAAAFFCINGIAMGMPDISKAREYFYDASQSSYPPAMYNYAVMIEKEDRTSALLLLEEAAREPYPMPEASYRVAEINENLGNNEKALEYYKRAYNLGIQESAPKIEHLIRVTERLYNGER